jgi:ABC transport system ATP-binding/permease protein
VKEKGVSPIQEKSKKKKMSYNEQREFETIEDDITGVEERLEEIAIELNDTGSNFEKAQELMNEEVELNEKLEHMMERWTYLTEKSEG